MRNLSACCDLAIKAGKIKTNPFDGMAAEMKVLRAKRGDTDINPFTADEKEAIIQAIATDQFEPAKSAYPHSHYANFFRVLFMCGCRPSELADLQWRNVTKDFRFITFDSAVIQTDDGRMSRQGLKTQERRKFPCNPALQELFKNIKPEKADPDSLVFPSPTGSWVYLNNLRNRVWKRVLLGLQIEYRRMYQTRSTFISHMIHEGVPITQIAKWVGNSAEVILTHYAGVVDQILPPDY